MRAIVEATTDLTASYEGMAEAAKTVREVTVAYAVAVHALRLSAWYPFR